MSLNLKAKSGRFAASSLVAATLAALVLTGAATPAAAAPATTATGQLTVTSEDTTLDNSCFEQVVDAGESDAEAEDFCTVTTVVEESAPETVSVAQARQFASQQQLSKAETNQFVAAAAAGTIQSKSWKHTYNAVATAVIHAGRTYWDGSKAWIATYRGNTGWHQCNYEGSYSVGWAVKHISCNKPAAGTAADALSKFELGAFVSGSPITLTVGLHYKITNKGVSSGWQNGG